MQKKQKIREGARERARENLSVSYLRQMKQESVAEADRAKGERKTATTVDNFLVFVC